MNNICMGFILNLNIKSLESLKRDLADSKK